MADKKNARQAHLIVLSIAIICTCACTKRNGTGQPYTNPVMLTSNDGKLHVDLVVAPATYTIGGHQFQGMLYNEQYMPALWRLRAGDVLTVTLHNKLSQETNLHFHGLNVSPLNNGDNVFLHIAPEQTFTYQIKIPERHIGLFWYHPHAHGDVDRQIIGGMSGGILVEGSDRLYPFLKGLTERVFLLKHHPIGRADYEELVTVNGTVTPTIPIRPGEAQFWQIGNIGADRFLRLKIDGMPFYLIGRDGYFVPRPIRMEEVLLGPGQRFSAIVVGAQPGRHTFQSVAFKFDEHQPPLPDVNLGTVVSHGPAADIPAAEAKVNTQHVNGSLYVEVLRSSPIVQRRTFAFSVNAQKTSFFINDQVFDENRTDVTVKLGDTEEWTILNKDSQYHDFHIHKTGFWLRKLTALTAISTVYATRSVFLRSEMGNRARPSSSFLSPIRKLSAGSCFTATS